MGSHGHVYISPQAEVSEATTMHKIVQIHKSIVYGTQFIAKAPTAGINHIEHCSTVPLHCTQLYVTKPCLFTLRSGLSSKIGQPGRRKPQYKFIGFMLQVGGKRCGPRKSERGLLILAAHLYRKSCTGAVVPSSRQHTN